MIGVKVETILLVLIGSLIASDLYRGIFYGIFFLIDYLYAVAANGARAAGPSRCLSCAKSLASLTRAERRAKTRGGDFIGRGWYLKRQKGLNTDRHKNSRCAERGAPQTKAP